MRQSILITTVSVLLACCTGCPIVVDVSDFREFRLEQEIWLFPCIDAGDVFEAHIERTDEGAYIATVDLFESAQYDATDCDDGVREGNYCVITRRVGPFTLTTVQSNELDELFGQVRIEQGIPLDCFLTVSDPCLLTDFVWDKYSVGGFYYCESPRVQPDDGAAIVAFLSEIAAGQ